MSENLEALHPDLQAYVVIMEKDERAALKKMPDVLTIWRGVGHRRAVRGMSWTIDQAKAASGEIGQYLETRCQFPADGGKPAIESAPEQQRLECASPDVDVQDFLEALGTLGRLRTRATAAKLAAVSSAAGLTAAIEFLRAVIAAKERG
jgi:hypothetical protein